MKHYTNKDLPNLEKQEDGGRLHYKNVRSLPHLMKPGGDPYNFQTMGGIKR